MSTFIKKYDKIKKRLFNNLNSKKSNKRLDEILENFRYIVDHDTIVSITEEFLVGKGYSLDLKYNDQDEYIEIYLNMDGVGMSFEVDGDHVNDSVEKFIKIIIHELDAIE